MAGVHRSGFGFSLLVGRPLAVRSHGGHLFRAMFEMAGRQMNAVMLNRNGKMVSIDNPLREALEFHAKELGKEVSELSLSERQQAWMNWVLAGKLEEQMPDTITLTREEVKDAIEVGCFFDYHSEHSKCARFVEKGDSVCLLCKRVTEFAKGGEEGNDAR